MEKTESTLERIGGYRVVRRLATGGTSEVLLAKAEGPMGFERSVVLKLLLPSHRGDEELAKMFAREAAAYARLSHPCIVRLYDFFALDARQAEGAGTSMSRYPGQLVMALEYVDGPTLQRLRGMLRSVGEHLDDRAAMHVGACVFEALAAAHAATDDAGAPAPVVHRDVNPSNILVHWDGQVKLADFGVAKVAGLTHQSTAGLIKGTYGYMAPEQVSGGAAVTARADVYAGGIVLWEMLARRRAFHRGALPEIEVLRAMEEPRIPSIDSVRPDLHPSVREAVRRALEPKAERRTLTAEEMVAVLRAIVPADEGREQLVKTLALVRHEPSPSPTSIPPPPNAEVDDAKTTAQVMRGGGPPRPAPPKRESGMMPAAAPPPLPPRALAAQAAARTAAGPARGMLPRGTASTAAAASDVDPDGDRPTAVPVTPAPPPPRSITPGLGLKAAIDEILQDMPSSSRTGSKPVDRDIGQLPPSPPPLKAALPALKATLIGTAAPPVDASPTKPPAASDEPAFEPTEFVAVERTLVMGAAARGVNQDALPTVRPPPEVIESTTAQMQTHPSGPPAEPSRGTQPMPPPLATVPLGGVAAMGAAAHGPPGLEPFVAGPPLEAPAPSFVGDSYRPAPSRPRAAIVLALVAVVAVVGAAAGYLVYPRWREKAAPAAPSMTTAPAVASAPPSSVPSEVASAPASATAAASATASASTTASVSATAPAGTTASVTLADVPAGSGLVKTEGAAPGHRIYVDERTVGQTPESVVVKCGTHQIKVGSAGAARAVDVPCGGEITVR